MICKKFESSAVPSSRRHAWTPRQCFAVPKSLTKRSGDDRCGGADRQSFGATYLDPRLGGGFGAMTSYLLLLATSISPTWPIWAPTSRTALKQLSQVFGVGRNGRRRRVSPVAVRPCGGPITERTAGVLPAWSEQVFMPHGRPSRNQLGCVENRYSQVWPQNHAI